MRILVLPGDGIGPEITDATLDVLRAADSLLNLNLTFETMDIGLASLEASGSTCPDAVMKRIPEVDGVILGPVSHYVYPPRDQGGINPSAELRVTFELGSNIIDGLIGVGEISFQLVAGRRESPIFNGSRFDL